MFGRRGLGLRLRTSAPGVEAEISDAYHGQSWVPASSA